MKKIIALVLSLVMVFALCACGAKTETPAAAPAAEAPAAAAPAAEAPAAEAPAAEAPYEYQKVTLQWGTTSSEGTVVVDAMKEFGEKISAATNGNVTVDVYPGSVLGSASDMLEQCQMGTLAMTNTQPAILAGIGADEQYVLSMPYVFTSFDQRWEVLYGEIGKELNQIVTDKCQGLIGFSYFGDGARNFFTNFEVNSVKDLEGHKLRVQSTELDNDWCNALGAIPTPTASSEMYQAMSTGLVDGAEQPIANYYSGKYYEVSKYFVLDGHTYNTIGIVFSEQVWNSLDEQLQQLITDTWEEIIQSKKQVILDNEAEVLGKIEEAGVKVVEVNDLADWAACMTSVYDKYSEQYGIGDYLTRIAAIG